MTRRIDFDTIKLVRISSDNIERQYNCPNCGDRKARLYLNVAKKKYYCFNCGIRGEVKRIETFLPFQDSPKLLTPKRPAAAHKINDLGIQYLKEHNVDPKVAYRMGVRSERDRITRLLFPARVLKGNEKQTRFVSSHNTTPRKKLNAYHVKAQGYGKIHPGAFAFENYSSEVHLPSIKPGNLRELYPAILVEGAADALRLTSYFSKYSDTWGYPIALFGKNLSEEGCAFLARNYKYVVVMLDRGDEKWERGGEEFASERLAAMLSVFMEGDVHNYRDLPAKDPASLTDAQCRQVFEEVG